MARPRIASAELTELFNMEEMKTKIQANERVAILFDKERYPTGNTVAHTFHYCRPIYERKYNVFCYLCVVGNNKSKEEFKIESIPTFIFYRNHEEIARFKDANQPAPEIPKDENDPAYVQKLKDIKDPKEYQLRRYLEELCADPK